MSERYADRYTVSYSIYGPTLDVDGLLAQVRPAQEFEVWHKGEARGAKRLTKTAGVRLRVAENARSIQVVAAIERFLATELHFLQAAAQRVNDDTYSVLSCAMWVYAKVPTTIWLPSNVLRRLSDVGVAWEVSGYPCADDDGP